MRKRLHIWFASPPQINGYVLTYWGRERPLSNLFSLCDDLAKHYKLVHSLKRTFKMLSCVSYNHGPHINITLQQGLIMCLLVKGKALSPGILSELLKNAFPKFELFLSHDSHCFSQSLTSVTESISLSTCQ